jgi:hypothetical protein
VSSNLETNFLKINTPVLQNQTTDGGDMNIEDEEQLREYENDGASELSDSDDELSRVIIL